MMIRSNGLPARYPVAAALLVALLMMMAEGKGNADEPQAPVESVLGETQEPPATETSAPVPAESPMMPQAETTSSVKRNAISLEAQIPDFKIDGVDFPSLNVYLGTSRMVCDQAAVVLQLPVSTISLSGGNRYTRVGNPYIGATVGDTNRVWVDIGGRLPLAADAKGVGEATAKGNVVATDINQQEAFLPDVLPLSSHLNLRYITPHNILFGVRAGLTELIDVGSQADGMTTFVDYSAMGGYRLDPVELWVEFTKRLQLTDTDIEPNQRMTDQLLVAAALLHGPVKPTIYWRLPVDDELNDTIRSVVGVRLDAMY